MATENSITSLLDPAAGAGPDIMILNMPLILEAGRTGLAMQILAEYAEAKQLSKSLCSTHANAAAVSSSFTKIA